MIRKLFRQVQFFFFTVSLAALFAMALNSAFTEDGFTIGHPRVIHEYISMDKDARLTQLANAIPMKQFKVTRIKAVQH